MMQVYKKNNLFIIEDTCSETIYPNLTQEEAVVLLKNFNRYDPEGRCNFAIDTDDIKFEYAFLDYKGKESEELKQQLVEKDKEIEQLKKFDDLNKTFFNLFRIAFKEPDKIDDLFNTLKTMQEKQDQSKILFVVEWLEKVRTQFLTNYSWYEETHRVCEKTDNFVIWLDNQIKELKEIK